MTDHSSNQSSDPRVCEHGSLRRKCEICTRDEEIEQLQRELADYAIGHVNQCGEISLLQIERDRLTAERDLLRVGDPKTVARTVVIDKVEYGKMVEANERMRTALQTISEGRGPFSIDQLTFASNVIDTMKQTAREALAHERVDPAGTSAVESSGER
jgi:hypothetical protein